MKYKNKIMLAMNSRENGGLMEYMNMVIPLMKIYPDAIDALNLPVIVRQTARNAGLPEAWLRTLKDIEAMQAARAEGQAQQQQMAMAEQAAGVAEKVGKTPADMRNAMMNQAPQ